MLLACTPKQSPRKLLYQQKHRGRHQTAGMVELKRIQSRCFVPWKEKITTGADLIVAHLEEATD
jgi:hypothetical protein